MISNQLNAHGGFTPAAVDPSHAINPGQVVHHHRSAQVVFEGTGTVPSRILGFGKFTIEIA
jgi:hypothetical protein